MDIILYKIKNKSKLVAMMIFTSLCCFVHAQNNLNMQYYDLGTAISGFGTGGNIGLDITTLDAVFGTVTVNGVVRTADFYNSDRSIAALPTNVSAYTGIQLVYLKGFNNVNYNSVKSISQAQADALINYVKAGGIVVGNMEGVTVQTVAQDFNKYVGQSLLLQTGVNISATPSFSTIPSTAVAYHNNGGVLNLNNAATSVVTTATASTFIGIPSESIIYSVSKPTTTAQCSSVGVLDFIAPSYPGDLLAINSNILGFAYLSGESQGPLNSAVSPNPRDDSQANINLANMIYDYLYTPSNMVTRRAWSKTSTDVNAFCPVTSTTLDCSAGSTAPSLSSTTLTNICPATTANLNSLHTGTAPAGSALVWFTNSTHTGTAYATPTAATADTYYAYYYDNTNNCYSPASSAVTVTITVCCNAGTAAPVIN